MSKIFLMCGKICSGKSTYARKLREQYKAAVLSVDEITLALFDGNAGDKLDDYVARTEKYLYGKSIELLESGINVVLDWGFWAKRERDEAREFYGSRGIDFEFVYIDITADEWKRRLEKRNNAVLAGDYSAYYVDEGLMEKFEGMFEKPDETEKITVITD
jgi:predicted kinase